MSVSGRGSGRGAKARRPANRLGSRGAPPTPEADDIPLDDVLQFMRVLWGTVHALQKASKRMNRQLGVTGPQRLVIRVIGLCPGLSAGRLATTLHLHPSTLTGILQRLVRQGFIKHGTDRHDRRRSVLHLTTEGQRLNKAVARTVEAAARVALRDVSARDQAAARAVLSALTAELEAPAAERTAARPGTRGRS